MKRSVYLSFDSDDLSLVNLFRGQAKNENNDLEFSDHSVKEPFDSESAEYIRRKIREKLANVSITACLMGHNTYKSRWVDWEIRTSASMQKGLVGVRLHSSFSDVTPRALSDCNIQPINWDIKEVVAAIEQAAS